jgi:hypothetical protein
MYAMGKGLVRRFWFNGRGMDMDMGMEEEMMDNGWTQADNECYWAHMNVNGLHCIAGAVYRQKVVGSRDRCAADKW